MTSTSSRSAELVRDLPVGTAATIGLCCSVYVCQMIFDINVRLFTMCPRQVLYLQHYYRIVTSCFFHGSLMHIGMNMLSTAAIATMVERRMGTFSYIFTVLWSVILTGIFSILLALGYQWLLHDDTLMNEHSLGFSGVMFHLLVIESNLQPNGSTRSLFGLVRFPSYAYPIVMLVVMQLIMPNVSFTGHLCGILTGLLQLFGCLDVILVNDSYLQEMEHNWGLLQFLVSKENFVPTPTNTSGESAVRRDPRILIRGLRRGCQSIASVLCRGRERLQVAIFGRGHQLNANVYLPTTNPWLRFSTGNARADRNSDDPPVAKDEENQQSQLL